MSGNTIHKVANEGVASAVDLGKYPLGLDSILDQRQVAALYGLKTHRTLETWRRQGNGPNYFRVGVRPLYRLRDVLDWQRSRLVRSTLDEESGVR